MLKAVHDATYEKAGMEFRWAVTALVTGGEPKLSNAVRWTAFDPARPVFNAVTTAVSARFVETAAILRGLIESGLCQQRAKASGNLAFRDSVPPNLVKEMQRNNGSLAAPSPFFRVCCDCDPSSFDAGSR